MFNDTEPSTLLAQLAHLPATEHALLLNRFKFLKLVQRVAAADVAEMIESVGLEALLYKSALEKLPPPGKFPLQGPTSVVGTIEHTSQRRVNRRDNTTAIDTSAEAPRRRRFATREEESKFIQRMARPPNHRDPFAHIRRTEQGRHEHSLIHRRAESPPSSVPRLRHGKHIPGHGWEDVEGNEMYYDNLNHDDVVVISSSEERHRHPGVAATNAGQVMPHATSPQQGRVKRPIPRVMPRPKTTLNQDYATHTEQQQVSQAGDAHTEPRSLHMPSIITKGDGVTSHDEPSPFLQDSKTSHTAPVEASNPSLYHGSKTRSRGAFAPKAKPQAAAEVPRVPMEVIRHASAIIAAKTTVAVPPPAPPPPQERLPSSRAAPQVGSWETPSIHYNSATSQSHSQSMYPPELRSGRKTDSDVQRGQSSLAPVKTLSDEALMEVASCVERMLQDHRSILDTIVKEEQSLPPPDTPTIKRRVAQGGRGGVAEDIVSGKAKTKKLEMPSVAVHTTSETPVDRIVQHAHNILEDISDEDDELLLVSRLQRQVGAMDRELEVIEERALHRNDLSEEEEKERVLRASALPTRYGRRVTIANPKVVIETEGAKRKRPLPGRRRRGELPRAIVERLHSFQKENHEYIHYTEKQWNTSNVTEQVFAQRLADALVDDAFQEVFQEVGEILDEYVEGLALHELQ